MLMVGLTTSAGPEVGKEEGVRKGYRGWAEAAKSRWPLPREGRNWSKAGQGCEQRPSAQLIPEDQQLGTEPGSQEMFRLSEECQPRVARGKRRWFRQQQVGTGV